MLFKKKFLDGIQNGTVTLAFRRWKRPTVRTGGTLLLPIGEVQIKLIKPVSLESISVADARNAGYPTRDDLLAELTRREKGEFYRIELGSVNPDPRIALRNTTATGIELLELKKKLQRLDTRSPTGAWVFVVLEILNSHPGVRAGDLCEMVDQEVEQFKRNVRKLKNLGLTISLGTGYRLSKRGEAIFDDLSLEAKRDATQPR